MQPQIGIDNRLELYKVLAEPMRLRVLALADAEELAIGELAELLGESQPNVSRHVGSLRRLGLLAERRQGTRVLVRLDDAARADAVVADALRAGRALCEPDGMLDAVAELVRRRDSASREFFAQAHADADPSAERPDELGAYLMAIAPLLPRRRLAVDVGTGEGRLLDVLCPLFERVVAIDREPLQLERARERARLRGYSNVELLAGDLHERAVIERIEREGPADAVFASRVLHHAPRPAEAVAQLASLARPGGSLLILDYVAHDDERMRDAQADVWLGFEPKELARHARAAGLVDVHVQEIPPLFRGLGPDHHLTWQICSARRSGAREQAGPTRHDTESEHG
jgi:DNA-binding transcriptional ArsR family regulator/protein-L-isoaspartate O-methyltransferase